MWSADNLCKQFGPRSEQTDIGPVLDPNCLTFWLKEFYEKGDFEKNQQTTKNHAGKELNQIWDSYEKLDTAKCL